MKRTRETINYSHPDQRWNISGALTFDGEDRDFEARKRHNQQLQKQYLLQQMEEKRAEQQRIKDMDQ